MIAKVAIRRSAAVFSLTLFVLRMARLAPLGIVGVSSFCEVLLSLNGKDKLLIAFRANQDARLLIGIHMVPLSCRNASVIIRD